jgi:hypothetical protein
MAIAMATLALGARAIAEGPAAGAATSPSTQDPWQAWADAEPLELAAMVDRTGDDALLAQLTGAASVSARLAAVRASGFLHTPELALVPLAELSSSRDPDLAPLAARRTFEIAQALGREGLSRREILPAALSPAKAALLRAAATRPRADIRRRLEEAAQLLAALGVP